MSARATISGQRAIVCGGTPSQHDLEVIRRVGEALALPTKAEQRAALHAMSEEGATDGAA